MSAFAPFFLFLSSPGWITKSLSRGASNKRDELEITEDVIEEVIREGEEKRKLF